MQVSTPAIVIRDYKYEDNRILTLLSRDLGVITAFANRANRMKSPLSSSTELLCYSDFVLFKSKGKFFVDVADSKYIFFSIRSDFEDLSLASYFAQLFSELAPVEENATPFIDLLLAGLYNMEEKKRPHLLIKAVVELRLLALAGYMPNLVGCKVCGSYEAARMFFSNNGELVCGDCYTKSLAEQFYPISNSVLAAARHIIYSDSKKLFSFSLAEGSLKALATISENYLLHKLERSLPTLEYYKSITLTHPSV